MTNESLNRYDRHIKLDKVGLAGQEKLSKANVLVIGAGGLGCPVLQYLTAAGVGHIGIVDSDTIDLSNLQRQILFRTADIGQPKALMAKKALKALNNLIKISSYNLHLTTSNALEIIATYDIVVDCTDNFATRYMINDACVLLDKILVYGAIHTFEGQVSVFNYKGGPQYRTLFPTPPLTDAVPSCSEVGVLGILPGIIGIYQSSEVLKIILGIGNILSGELFIMNVLTNKSYHLKINESDQIYPAPTTVEAFEVMNYPEFCGILNQLEEDEILFDHLKNKLDNKNVVLIDVREAHETPKYSNDSILYMPLSDLEDTYQNIPKDKEIYIFCHLGFRSLNAVRFLKSKGNQGIIKSIHGGIEAMLK